MVESMGLKIWYQGYLKWYDLPANVRKMYQVVQKLLVEEMGQSVITW
jgi:hypothetical protein